MVGTIGRFDKPSSGYVAHQKSIDDRLLVVSFALFLNSTLLRTFFEMVLGRVGLPGSDLFTLLTIYVPIFIVIISRFYHRQRIGITPFIITYLLLAAIFASSLALHPNYASVMFDSSWPYNIWRRVFSPLSAVWSILFISLMRESNIIIRSLQIAAYLIFCYGTFQFFEALRSGYWSGTNSSGIEVQHSYSLTFGYEMLTAIVVFIMLAFLRKNTPLHMLLAALGFLMVLFGGSRAPAAFALAALAIFGTIFAWRRFHRTALFLPLLLTSLTASVVFIVNFERILLRLGRSLQSVGISSRSLDSVLNGSFTDDNGRSVIYELSQNYISNQGFFGYGVYGDRYLLVQNYWWGYPHNIVLEFQMSYGTVPGILILVALALLVTFALVRANEFAERILVVFFLVLCLQLVVSLSYLYNPWFWAAIGFSTHLLSSTRRVSQSSD